MSSDDNGRVIPFPAIGLRPPIGDGAATTSAPPPPPPAPPADQEAESDLVTVFPALAGAQLTPPLALTLPALADDGDVQAADADQAETVHRDGGITAREAATLGVMVASAIAVACLRGSAAFASWCRTRAEHHRTVRAQADKGTGSTGTGGNRGRVPSGPEYGRSATRNASTGAGRGGSGRGSGGGGRAPAAFRSGGCGSRGAGGSSKAPAATGKGSAGTGPGRKNKGGGSGASPTSDSTSPKAKPRKGKDKGGGGAGGSGSSGGGPGSGKTPRGPKGAKLRKPKGSGTDSRGGGSSSGGSGTPTRKGKGWKGLKRGKDDSASPSSTSPKGKGGKGKGGKGKGGGGGSKSPATRTRGTTPATRTSRARALTRRAVVRAARRGGGLVRRGGRYLAQHTPPAARKTGRYLRKHGRRVARHTRRWSRARWDRIAARAEARWDRRQQAAAAAAAAAATGTTGPAAGPTAPSSGPAPTGSGPAPTGTGTGSTRSSDDDNWPWGPGPDDGPWVGYEPLTPPPAMTDPYAVTFERDDAWDDESRPVDLTELVVTSGDTPPSAAPPGKAWEPLKGVEDGWFLVDVAEVVEPEPVLIPAARTATVPSKEALPVSDALPATPSAIADGVAAMAGPAYDSGAAELTIYDLIDADEDAAEEIVARVDTAREDARAAAALVGHMEDLKATIVARKIPGALFRYACRLQEKAAQLAADSRALAQELPAASEAISAAGKNAAVRHKPLADTTRDHGHAAPAEHDYHG
ncbi:hypothetical protein [Streptomyces chartreusis]|uniref:hypothetical protein n=1 Tax=Streptomyces chartreusis TaxID=1969 RepID=UPI0037F16B52